MQHDQDRDSGPPSELCIAGWQIQPSNLRIIKNGKEVRLEPKVMSVLICLANRPGQTLTRSELEEAVWPDVIVGVGIATLFARTARTVIREALTTLATAVGRGH